MIKPTGRLLFAYNTITELNGRIVELEKERDEHMAHAYYVLETCMVFSPKKFEAHNLEQQAKGISDYTDALLKNLECYSVDDVNSFEEKYTKALRDQAEALGEQK
jgi:hypothetical protein